MILRSLASAVPPRSWSQQECWTALTLGGALRHLKPRSASLLEKVLLGSNGIERRHFCTDRIEDVFDRDAQQLNETFEREAPALGAAALRDAMTRADTDHVDALFVCTCTGYLCPGLTSHIAERTGLSGSTYLMDLSGAGCGAAIPALRAASHYLAAHPSHRAAVVAVEVCSAAFYANDDPGVLISLCLFGDAACAAVLEGEAFARASDWRFSGFSTLHRPEQREKIRFINREGKLCNQLHRAVPEVAAEAVAHLFPNHGTPVHRLISHAGGRDVLEAIRIRLPDYPLAEAAEVLRTRGNCSSPSVLMALEHAVASATPEDQSWWLVSFGAGFAAHGCLLQRHSGPGL